MRIIEQITVVPYNNKWVNDFEEIKRYLSQMLSGYEIIHVGSTSIPGLRAKPIIDMDIVIDNINDLSHITKTLEKLNYVFEGDWGIKGRYAYRYLDTNLPKHHLYVCLRDDVGFIEHITFKQYLLDHPEACADYASLKLKLAKDFSLDRQEYEMGKTDFVLDCLKKAGYERETYPTMMPDFNHCLINVTSSIEKYFQVSSPYPSLPLLDDALKGAQHVFLIVLDGMGKAIMDAHLEENEILQKHVKTYLSSLFPPTTVAVTTALQSGLLPGETGWIGWQQYFKGIKRNMTLFTGIDYYTEEVLKVKATELLPYEKITDRLKNMVTHELFPSFLPGGFDTFSSMVKKMVEISKGVQPSYSYAYWSYPDKLIHEYGCKSEIVTTCLKELNQNIQDLFEHAGNDSCFIITADHGLIDIKTIFLSQFPDIMQFFVRQPAIENRCAAFTVNDPEAFKLVFNQYLGSYFKLYTSHEFMDLGFLGKRVEKAKDFLGDFVAISIDQYELTTKNKSYFKATHAGMTNEEMIVPLIILKK